MSESENRKIYVVHGSESSLLKPIVSSIAKSSPVIRIFRNQMPAKLQNCIDLQSVGDLGKLLERETSIDPARVVVIGAAAQSQNKLYSQMTSTEIGEIIETNVVSYANLIAEVLPTMIRMKFGRFVYLSSFRSIHHVNGATLYGASKAFGERLFAGVGSEYGRLNICSTSIRMGYFEGRMALELSKDQLQKLSKKISLRRLGTETELLRAIEFAIENPYSNGGIIELHGGLNYE